MRKNSVIDSDRDETVLSELSYCGYYTADEELALYNYMLHLISQNDAIVYIDVEEKRNERVNGGDLDDNGEDAREFEDKMREV